MSLYKVAVIARNPKREERATPPVEALVDTVDNIGHRLVAATTTAA